MSGCLRCERYLSHIIFHRLFFGIFLDFWHLIIICAHFLYEVGLWGVPPLKIRCWFVNRLVLQVLLVVLRILVLVHGGGIFLLARTYLNYVILLVEIFEIIRVSLIGGRTSQSIVLSVGFLWINHFEISVCLAIHHLLWQIDCVHCTLVRVLVLVALLVLGWISTRIFQCNILHTFILDLQVNTIIYRSSLVQIVCVA